MRLRWLASLCLALSLSVAHAGSSSPWELKGSLAFASALQQYLLVYSSNEVTGGPDIYGRVLGWDGTPSGKDFRLSTQAGKMDKPVVVYNPLTERFLVVWGRKLGSSAEIVGLNVRPNGKIDGEEFRISFSELYDQRPSIAYCPGRDRFLVTWTRGTQYDFEKGVSDIYGQFLDGNGTHLAGSNFMIASATRNQFKSEVSCSAVNDRFLVVWEDQRNVGTQDDIYGQLISSDGTMMGGNFLIAGTSDVERRPVAAASKDGTYLVVWESDGVDHADLYCQRVDANGKMLRDPVQIGSNLGGLRDRPAAAYLESQDVFLVVYHNTEFGGVSDGIYGQFVGSDGKLRETTFPLTTAQKAQYRPDVAPATNSFLVVWTDFRDTADVDGKRDVYEYYGRLIGNDMPLSARWRNPESR